MKKKLTSTILATSMVVTSFMTAPVMAEETLDLSDKKVGICIYTFNDNFMTLYRTELERYLVEEVGFSAENVVVQDSQNDMATQSNQIDAFIADGVDLLIINPTNVAASGETVDKAVEAGIPLIFINREPDEQEEARWAENDWDVTYIGSDARQSGTMQGEIIIDVGLEKLDMNGNGVVDYVMIQGDPENVDTKYRTEFSIKALEDEGWEVNCLDSQVGMFLQDQGQTLVANSLSQYGDEIEVIFCNNDAMALGAMQSISAAGRTVNEDIYLVGVDALQEALESVKAGTLTGTVFNDHFAQSHTVAEACLNYLNGTGNEHKILCDYAKVTSDNVDDILAMVQ